MRLAGLSIAIACLAAPAEARTKSAELDTSPPTYTWIGFGVAGAGVIVGTLFGADALQAASSAREQCAGTRCPPSAQTFIDQSKSSATISTISFSVALVGAGVGFFGLFSRPEREEAPQPMPGPQLSLRVSPSSVMLGGA
ncbi:MAG: hypothetical protein ACXWP4_02405, partial [Polyangiales bacterium]